MEKSLFFVLMDVKIKYLLYIFCFFVACCKQNKTKTPPPPGYYGDDLLLAHEPVGNLITGIYEKGHLDNMQSDQCRFYFTGKWLGKKSNLIRWPIEERDANNTYGVLEMKDDHSFIFYWQKPLESCFDAPDFLDKKVVYHCTDKRKWQFIRTVLTEMVNIHAGPSPSTTVIDTLYKNNIVKIFESRKKWHRIEAGSKNEIQGWIFSKDLKKFPG